MSDKLLKRFQGQVEQCQAKLDKFAVEFAKDPAGTLAWGTDTFAAAAKMKVLKQIVNSLETGKALRQIINSLESDEGTLENIRSTLTSRVLHKAKYPAQSTSPTSNLIEQYELSACADILGDLEYM